MMVPGQEMSASILVNDRFFVVATVLAQKRHIQIVLLLNRCRRQRDRN